MNRQFLESKDTFNMGFLFRKNYLLLYLFFVTLQLVIILAFSKYGFIALIAFVGLILLAYSFYNTFFGLCLIILSHIFYQDTEEINIQEIFYGLLFFSVMSGWFLNSVIVQGNRIVKDYRELWLVLFLSIACGSILVTLAQGHDLFQWFRYLVPFLTYLLYFPLVDQVTNWKRFKIVLICTLVLIIFTAIKALFMYKMALESIKYLWEILASRQTGDEPYFLAGMTIAMSSLLYVRSNFKKVLLGLLTLFFGFSLAITFSRGYWIAGIVSIITLFFLLTRREKTKASLYFLIFMAIGSITAFLLLGDFSEAVLFQLQERLGSIGKTALDKSVQNRVLESKAVIHYIIKNPIIGYGLSKQFSYYNTINEATKIGPYVHNAYLSIWFKLGLVGLLSYLSFYFGFIIKGWFFSKKEKDTFKKALCSGIIAVLVGMLAVSITSPQFTHKSSILLITIFTAFIFLLSRGFLKR